MDSKNQTKSRLRLDNFMRNTKGDFLTVIEGMKIIFGGALVFIVMHAVFYGVSGSQGIFEIAEETMNVTSHPAWIIVKTSWSWVIFGILIAGFIVMLLWSQRFQPYQETYGR